jgi:DNA-binding ferritin-like protein (Dps family)
MRLPMTTQRMIQKCEDRFGKGTYDYSISKFVNSITKITVICPKHGKFQIDPYTHIRGARCYQCGVELREHSKFMNRLKDLPNKFKEIHGDTYNYDWTSFKGLKQKIKILCKEHGEFYQTPETHLWGQGCPRCRESHGERKIHLYFTKMKIPYLSQYKPEGCVSKRQLSFDFYLPQKNMVIEFQGEQHFRPIGFGGNLHFKEIKIRDQIKKDYCLKNNIRFEEILYNEDVDTKLDKILNQSLD